jgi:hypothetical protein
MIPKKASQKSGWEWLVAIMIKSLNHHISPTIYPLIIIIMTITIHSHLSINHYSHEISPVTNHSGEEHFQESHAVHPSEDPRFVETYPLVNIQKAMENGHRNSGFSHEKW